MLGEARIKVIVANSDNGSCYQYRIAPYKNIVSDIKFEIRDTLVENDINDEDVRAVLIQRPNHELLPDFIRDLKDAGKIVVIEIDDDLRNLPASNPSFEHYRKTTKFHSECLKLADYVHCSTPELATNYPNKSIVFYNAVDLTKYHFKKEEHEFVIGWQGSPTHLDSITLIKSGLEELMNKGIKVKLMSNLKWLEGIFKPHENLIMYDWVDVEESYKIPFMFDINLTPLPDFRFNRAKSELKVVEAAAWGIPSVSSPVAPFVRFNKLSGGGNVLVKKEKPKYWVQSIVELLTNDDLYKECSFKSRKAVEDIYNIEIVNKQRKEWWERILL